MRRFSPLGLVLLVCAVGCQSQAPLEERVVGTYNGKINMTKEMESNPMAKSMIENAKVTLELKKDKTFAMNSIVPVNGTWSLADHALTLTPTEIMGMSMKDIEAKSKAAGQTMPANTTIGADVTDDAKTITTKSTPTSQGTMTFTRADKS